MSGGVGFISGNLSRTNPENGSGKTYYFSKLGLKKVINCMAFVDFVSSSVSIFHRNSMYRIYFGISRTTKAYSRYIFYFVAFAFAKRAQHKLNLKTLELTTFSLYSINLLF